LYIKARVELNLSSNEVYEMTVAEISDLLSENDKYKKYMMLEQSVYNSQLILQEKAKDNYDELLKNILGKEVKATNDRNKLLTDVKRYKMISKRIGLKFPGGD
jgi:tRNA A37 N6-isopentenylltransferase MiaA